MVSSLETPWVHISYSLWFRHSNSTTPRLMVLSAKYRRFSPPSSKWRPGHAGISFITSNTTSANSYKEEFKKIWDRRSIGYANLRYGSGMTRHDPFVRYKNFLYLFNFFCRLAFTNPQIEGGHPHRLHFSFHHERRQKQFQLTLFLFGVGPSNMPALHLKHHLQKKINFKIR